MEVSHMKIMIASDIHGSAYHCRRLLDAFDREGAGRLLLLGDILYHGPRNDLPDGYAPKEVTAMLNDRKSQIFCVRGNCDTEVDQMVLEFPILADYCILMLIPLKTMKTAAARSNRPGTQIPDAADSYMPPTDTDPIQISVRRSPTVTYCCRVIHTYPHGNTSATAAYASTRDPYPYLKPAARTAT